MPSIKRESGTDRVIFPNEHKLIWSFPVPGVSGLSQAKRGVGRVGNSDVVNPDIDWEITA